MEIDDMLLLNNMNNEVQMLNTIIQNKRKEVNKLNEQINQLNNTLSSRYDYYEDSVDQSVIENDIDDIENKKDTLQNMINKLDDLEAKFNIKEAKINEILDLKGTMNNSDVFSEKSRFLEDLIFNKHISQVEETSETYFKKLIELYGEEYLAKYCECIPNYISDDLDNIYFQEYDEIGEDNQSLSTMYPYHTIHDFVSGEEDNILKVVSNQPLKDTLLISKLKTLEKHEDNCWDILKTFTEYGDLYKGNVFDKVCRDELGDTDIEKTLLNFNNCHFLEDPNFYICLAKNSNNDNLSIEALLKYLRPEMINDEFIESLKKVRATKEVEFQSPKETTNDELIEWLEQKESTLAQLEKESNQISIAENIIDNKNLDIGE